MKRGIGGQGKSLNWRNPCVRRGLDLTEEGFKLRSASVDMIGDIYRDKKGGITQRFLVPIEGTAVNVEKDAEQEGKRQKNADHQALVSLSIFPD